MDPGGEGIGILPAGSGLIITSGHVGDVLAESLVGVGVVLHCGNILHQNTETVNPLGRFFLLFFRFP